MLVTAGPTHEPIDEVRFIGNRSSGRLGAALAGAAAARGWSVRLLLGPSSVSIDDSRVGLIRFRTVDELSRLLDEHATGADVIVMAAAVADFRPKRPAGTAAPAKLRRSDGGITLELEPTPDLLAGLCRSRRPGQFIVGFALEPAERMVAAAKEKLDRKGADMIVANPLETMDAASIEAVVIDRDGSRHETGGVIDKARFADWLLERIERAADAGKA